MPFCAGVVAGLDGFVQMSGRDVATYARGVEPADGAVIVKCERLLGALVWALITYVMSCPGVTVGGDDVTASVTSAPGLPARPGEAAPP
jgi:hypothetical protein